MLGIPLPSIPTCVGSKTSADAIAEQQSARKVSVSCATRSLQCWPGRVARSGSAQHCSEMVMQGYTGKPLFNLRAGGLD